MNESQDRLKLLATIRNEYGKATHNWSVTHTEEELDLLMTIPKTMIDMAEGRMAGKTVVNNARVGLGKTSMLKVSIPILTKTYETTGFLVVAPSVQACIDLGTSLKDDGVDVCIYGSDSAYVGEDGNHDPDRKDGTRVRDALGPYKNAQVMICTHAMMHTRQKVMSSFADSVDFSWEWANHSRQVTVWDEGLRTHAATSSDLTTLMSLQDISHYVRNHEDFLEDAIQYVQDNRDNILAGSNALADVSALQWDVNDVKKRVLTRPDRSYGTRAIHALQNLLCWEGGEVLISGRKVFGVLRTLTTDFGANGILVLDASGSIAPIYDHHNVEHIKNGSRDYSHVRVDWVQVPSGSRTWTDPKRASEVHEVVQRLTQGNHKYIVMGRQHAPEMVPDYLPDHHFMYWGSAEAVGSNDFTEYDGFIALCLNWLPSDAFKLEYACARKGTPVTHEAPDEFKHRRMMVDLHQAVGRGSVRLTSENPTPYHVVVVGPEAVPVGQMLQAEFPGCKIREIKPGDELPAFKRKPSYQKSMSQKDQDIATIAQLQSAISKAGGSMSKEEVFAMKSKKVWSRLRKQRPDAFDHFGIAWGHRNCTLR